MKKTHMRVVQLIVMGMNNKSERSERSRKGSRGNEVSLASK